MDIVAHKKVSTDRHHEGDATAAPLSQAQIDISAPVAKVWALVSDLNRMPQWSPQCRLMKSLGPLRQGTRTINLNRRKYLVWPTTSTITEVIPEKKMAFRVNANNTGPASRRRPKASRRARAR